MGTLKAVLGDDAAVLRDRNYQLLLLAMATYPLGAPYLSPILESLTGPFGVSTTAVGLLITAFFGPSLVVTPIAGTLADRYGRRPILAVGLAFLGGGGIAITLTSSFPAVLGLRLVQGMGAGAILPVVVASIGDLYEGDAEATAQGLRTTVHGGVAALSPLLAGALVLLDWRYPFLLYGIAFPIAVVVLFWFEEPAERGYDRPSNARRELLRLAVQPRILAVFIGFFLVHFVFIAIVTYNSVIVIRGAGGSVAAASTVVTITTGTIALSGSQAGRVTARFESRYVPMLGLNAALGLGLGALAVAVVPVVAFVGAALIGLGFGLLQPIYRSILTASAPDEHRGGLVGIGETIGRAGSTLPPVVMGVVINVLTPTIGLIPAVRWTTAGTAVVCGLLGIVCVIGIRVSPSIRPSDR